MCLWQFSYGTPRSVFDPIVPSSPSPPLAWVPTLSRPPPHPRPRLLSMKAARWRNCCKLLSWNLELDGCHQNVAGSLGVWPGEEAGQLMTSNGMRCLLSQRCQSSRTLG